MYLDLLHDSSLWRLLLQIRLGQTEHYCIPRQRMLWMHAFNTGIA